MVAPHFLIYQGLLPSHGKRIHEVSHMDGSLVSTSPHRTYKGCAMCKYHKDTKFGDSIRMPRAELKARGRNKRASRKDIPEDQRY